MTGVRIVVLGSVDFRSTLTQAAVQESFAVEETLFARPNYFVADRTVALAATKELGSAQVITHKGGRA